ncbi:hypothetical protein [Leekyejoonella antrihumi]|uniref:hypothetical protein n=1 Tax=Leekyejoonella antrihumi TaxID=1660198 RepID=UPI001644E8A9|nr:hypothetical protein [Leekyejoonella antrihumi]
MDRITRSVTPLLRMACASGGLFGMNPAIVLDADDTTLMSYDMTGGAMKFNYNPPCRT